MMSIIFQIPRQKHQRTQQCVPAICAERKRCLKILKLRSTNAIKMKKLSVFSYLAASCMPVCH